MWVKGLPLAQAAQNLLRTPTYNSFAVYCPNITPTPESVLYVFVCSFAPSSVYYNCDSWNTMMKATLMYG